MRKAKGNLGVHLELQQSHRSQALELQWIPFDRSLLPQAPSPLSTKKADPPFGCGQQRAQEGGGAASMRRRSVACFVMFVATRPMQVRQRHARPTPANTRCSAGQRDIKKPECGINTTQQVVGSVELVLILRLPCLQEPSPCSSPR